MNIKGTKERVLREQEDIVSSYVPNFNPSIHGTDFAHVWLYDKMWAMVCRISGDK